MPAIARGGDATTTGHLCTTNTTINITTTTGIISKVFANGIGIACVGNLLSPHSIGIPPICIPDLTSKILSGSSTVFIAGIPIARLLDSCDVGGVIIAGSPTVNVG